MASLSDEEVLERARDWASFHTDPDTRHRMDVVLKGLSEADKRRVYLCGQRVAAGMTPKVIPAATTTTKGGKSDDDDHKATKATARRERHHATKQGSKDTKK